MPEEFTSRKVVPLMVDGFMAWLKVAVIRRSQTTPVLLLAGDTETTVGGVVVFGTNTTSTQ